MASLLALCLRLGFWQLERAEQKRQVSMAGQQTVSLEQALTEPTQTRWSRLTLSGHYLPDGSFLLDNQTHQGQPGYQVFSRFQLNSGQQLLINRGWISKQQQPTEPATKQTISGIIAPYRRAGMRLGLAVVSPPEARPVVVNYPTQAEWETLVNQPLLPFTLWLDADQADGYLRQWQVQSVPPEKHLGYAFQWFAMATAVAVISLILLIRLFRQHD